MKVFLIIVAVLAVIIIAVLSLSATVTLVYDKGWHTKVQILFIEKDIVLSKILSFILFPEKKAEQVVKESDEKKKSKKDSKSKKKENASENSVGYHEPDRLSVYAVSAALYHQCSVYAVRRALHNGNEHRAKTSDAGKFRGSIS